MQSSCEVRGKREEERKGPPNKSATSCHHYVSAQLVSASALLHADLPCRLATFHPAEVETLPHFAEIAHSFSSEKGMGRDSQDMQSPKAERGCSVIAFSTWGRRWYGRPK